MEIQINKDVGSYEPKVIGPFTVRQALCLLIGSPICVAIYKYGSMFLPADAVSFILLVPAAATWLFGWLKPYGMPMERFLKSIFVNMILAPGNRTYKTKQKEYAKSFAEAETQHERKTSAHKAEKKPKYKRSPDGVE